MEQTKEEFIAREKAIGQAICARYGLNEYETALLQYITDAMIATATAALHGAKPFIPDEKRRDELFACATEVLAGIASRGIAVAHPPKAQGVTQ